MYNKGFTLIELLVVVAVLIILSSIVFNTLTTARTKSFEVRQIVGDVGEVRFR
jgi:prepilin-type N-terminal cleavage/methylation domain-containing protein